MTKKRPPILECIKLIPGYDPCRAVPDGWYFDEEAAQRYVDFIEECCTHVEGMLAYKPFIMQPWQVGIVANLFGWKRPNGSRRYRECLIFVPRKNGKTPLAAAIALASMTLDGEVGAYNVCAAADADQAALLFRQAGGMVENDAELSQHFKVYKGIGQRSIAMESQNSRLKVVSSDANTKHGGNGHLAIIDELHAQKNRDLVDVLQTSMASANRLQPLLMHVTTSDFDREGSICNEKHSYAGQVRDGVVDDPEFLPVIYEASDEDEWTDESTWWKANPNLGVSVSLEYLRRECKRAQEIPAYENTFKRLHLNIRTQADVRWLSLESWDRGSADDPLAWREEQIELLRGRQCYGALDLATKRDLSALSLVFPPIADEGWVVLPWFWIPFPDIEQRVRRDKVPYDAWVNQGWIEPFDSEVFDKSWVRAKVLEISSMFQIMGLGFDAWNGEWVNQELGSEDGMNVVRVDQSIRSLNGAAKDFEARVVAGTLHHGGNPVLRWMANNVSCYMDGNGNIRPDKKKSTERIDGISATVSAIAVELAGVVPEQTESFYEKNVIEVG